jgi:hypothetical protein
MKLEEMKIHGNTVGTVTAFHVESAAPKKERAGLPKGTIWKAGVCVAALFAALAIRVGTGTVQTEAVTVSKSMDEAVPSDAPGSLRFVDNVGQKWAAPVATNDVELLRDRQMVRFTAAEENVHAGFGGTVVLTETEERYGNYLRLQGEDGMEIVLYGFESFAVRAGEQVEADAVLGTVPVGRSIYLSIEQNGKPLDPSEYFDLTIRNPHASV